MDLVRKVNSTYCQVNMNIQILEKEGIVSSYHYGRMRIIILRNDNPKTVKILKALKILKNTVLDRKHNLEKEEKRVSRAITKDKAKKLIDVCEKAWSLLGALIVTTINGLQI
jgi:hypothetical protein